PSIHRRHPEVQVFACVVAQTHVRRADVAKPKTGVLSSELQRRNRTTGAPGYAARKIGVAGRGRGTGERWWRRRKPSRRGGGCRASRGHGRRRVERGGIVVLIGLRDIVIVVHGEGKRHSLQ